MARLIAAAIAALLAAAPAAASEITVAPGELPSRLARARDGETLRLGAGAHRGPLVLARTVRLVGEPGAVVEGDGRGTTLTLAADGIVVSNLEIRGSGADLSGDDAAVLLLEARGITVERLRVAARAFGIYVRAGGDHRIVANEVTGDASLPIARRGNGIHLWHTSRNEVTANRVADVRDGIYLSFAHDNRIRGNRGERLRYGIHYMYSERNALIANRFDRSSGGIALMFSMRNRIEGNETRQNRDFGILCQQLERSEIVDNHAAGNGRGFFVENSVGNRFVGNRLEENGVGAFLTAGSEENVFTRNRFADNLVQVHAERAGRNAWSDRGRGNGWSDYAGPDWNGDGVGETPYRVVTARSALLARRPEARWFLASPALALLDWWAVSVDPPAAGAHDPAPLVGR